MTPRRTTPRPVLTLAARTTCAALVGVTTLMTGGCGNDREELLSLPDQSRAVRALAALEAAGIPSARVALKSARQPGGEWVLTTLAADAPGARRVIVDLDLLTPPNPGYEAIAGASSLVPSREQILARWMIASAAETQRTLEAVQGVVLARVHLTASAAGLPAGSNPGTPADLAAVAVIRYSRHAEEQRATLSAGSEPTNGASHQHTPLDAPINADAVRAILCRTLPGLEPHRIDVVFSPVLRTSTDTAAATNARPIAPINAQAPMWIGLGAVGLGAVLVFSGVVFWQFLRRRTPAW
jgi:type III secretory pathway lipoprotein EscJ